MQRTIESIHKNGPFKFFRHHIEYLNKFRNWNLFNAKSDIPTLDGVKIEIKKGERCFYFRAKSISEPKNEAPVVYQSIGYGFNKHFTIEGKKIELEAPIGVNILNLRFGSEYVFVGNIDQLNTPGFFEGKNFYRAIIPIEYEPHNGFSIYFDSNPVKVDNFSKLIGLLTIKDFDLLEYSFESINYLVIDSRKKMSYSYFRENLDNVIYSFAFVTGNLCRNERFTFSSEYFDFKSIEGFAFKRLHRTIMVDSSVIPFRFLRAIEKRKEFGETRISSEIFDKIVFKVAQEKELLRCIKLLTEAGDLSLEMKTSIYSVCLETIRNIISSKNQEKLNPFKVKADCKKFIKMAKELLFKFSESSFNNRSTVIKRIENVNQLGNTESFISIFNLMNISLTEDDIECLKKRDDFLHGRIPLNEDENSNIDNLIFIADKLHQLISYLILKYCGFRGVVLNRVNLSLLLKKKPLQNDKYMLREI